MTIAVFHNLPPGGAKRTVYEQVKHLSQKHELRLFQLSNTNEDFLSLYPFVKSIHTYPFSLSSNRLLADYQKFFVLPQIHRRMAQETEGADVALIHADFYTQAPHILRYLKIPSLYFCQEMLRIAYESELAFTDRVPFSKKYYEIMTRHVKKFIDRTNAQSASMIFTNSGFTGEKVQKEFNRAVKAILEYNPKTFSLFEEVLLKIAVDETKNNEVIS